MCVPQQMGNGGPQLLVLVFHLETGSLVVCCFICQATWPQAFTDFPESTLQLKVRIVGLRMCLASPVCPGVLSSGPHT